MMSIKIIFLFFITFLAPFCLAKAEANAPAKEAIEHKADKAKNQAQAAQQEENEHEDIPTLSESINTSSADKKGIQQELVQEHGFQLETQKNYLFNEEEIAKANNKDERIDFVDLELKISKRPEENIVITKKGKNALTLESKSQRTPSSKKDK